MQLLHEFLGFWQKSLPVDFLRYMLVAVPVFILLYLWKGQPLVGRRIFTDDRQTRRQFAVEFGRSMLTVLVFSIVGALVGMATAHGYTRIYLNLADYGTAYAVFSFAAAVVLHDAYFYWTHRLMHWRPLFRMFHLAHHRSVQPSPLAAYSFALPEILIEAAVFPIVLVLVPMHPLAIFAWMIFMIVKNVIGHAGFELYPRGFAASAFTGWNTTVTHHELHHRHLRGNYGLYFTWWDRWMKTERPEYLATFAEVTTRSRRVRSVPAILFLTMLVLIVPLGACARMDRLDYTRVYSRAGWQLPDQVIAAMGVRPGDVVADLGSGSGYFTLRLAEAVGPTGRVYAVDVDAQALADLRETAGARGLQNIETVLVSGSDHGVPPQVRLVFSCNSYHHLPDHVEYFTRLRESLGPAHQVAVVDHFHDQRGFLRLFISSGHWTPKDVLLREMRAAGYTLHSEHDFLPTQHFHIFKPGSSEPSAASRRRGEP